MATSMGGWWFARRVLINALNLSDKNIKGTGIVLNGVDTACMVLLKSMGARDERRVSARPDQDVNPLKIHPRGQNGYAHP